MNNRTTTDHDGFKFDFGSILEGDSELVFRKTAELLREGRKDQAIAMILDWDARNLAACHLRNIVEGMLSSYDEFLELRRRINARQKIDKT